MKRILITLVALLTLAVVPASAQTYLSTTTLSAAVTASQNSVTVASASGIVAGGKLYIDHELLNVTAVSGTTISVFRPQGPTAHNSAAVVIVIPVAAQPSALVTTDPRAGACTPSSYSFLPIINTDTGNVWLCWAQGSSGPNASRLWHATNTASLNGVYSLLVNLQ